MPESQNPGGRFLPSENGISISAIGIRQKTSSEGVPQGVDVSGPTLGTRIICVNGFFGKSPSYLHIQRGNRENEGDSRLVVLLQAIGEQCRL
jgi:hypothetical protein